MLIHIVHIPPDFALLAADASRHQCVGMTIQYHENRQISGHLADVPPEIDMMKSTLK